jgi:uncharacterized membrane protein
MKNKYRQAKMVNWFEPRMLLQTGLKAVISGLFGNYADRREMEAALGENQQDDWENIFREYREPEEIWVDFISDTGDGFNSTYSVAVTASQPSLSVKVNNVETKLPRAKILILGGDQIYPTPTTDIYHNKFRIPFEAAYPEDRTSGERSYMYAIPGNHDWYDGLGNFIKVFCQQRGIGNWETRQHRSYFALPLPDNYWIWATDIQLNEDIDKPQQDYFRDLAKDRMNAGDKVILCTAEPAWVYKEIYKDDKSYERLQFFIQTYITGDKAGVIGKKFQLTTVLTGDLHHYSHYCSGDGLNGANHYVGAGGGGAFLHLTNNLPDELKKLDEKNLKLKKSFPDEKESLSLLLGNLAFPFKNLYFSFLLGLICFLFYWLLESEAPYYMKKISDASLYDFFKKTWNVLLGAPFISILGLALIAGFYQFTDVKTGKKGVKLFGLLHGILHFLLIFFLIWTVAVIHAQQVNNTQVKWLWHIVYIAELIIGGMLLGGFLMGLYLYIANRFLGIHIDESSSALICEDYKSFLRMHISKEGVTIYPIGIKKVTKAWKQHEAKDNISFEGNLPQYHLIEDPIYIKSTLL